ncbi:esterase/lipase family protein [Nocardia sp. CWNU-33]|uniref:esterase/lipase family protein n=1 Tax=Nocardia sp. CWNU-33 TaxID=3392117 RepID=UPI00398F77B2
MRNGTTHKKLVRTCLRTTFGLAAVTAPIAVTPTPLVSAAPTGTTPAGAPQRINQDSCAPTVPDAVPVVLLHGVAGDADRNWSYLGPTLANAGFCVYSFTYGGANALDIGGLGPLDESGREVEQQLAQLIIRLRAPKIDLIGHSQGGVIAQYLVKAAPAIASHVRTVIAISAPTHGVIEGPAAGIFGGVIEHVPAPPSVNDLITGSEITRELESGPVTVPGIAYTTVASTADPVTSFQPGTTRIDEPGVENHTIQTVCPNSRVGHAGIVLSPTTAAIVLNALDRSTVRTIPCQDDLPV